MTYTTRTIRCSRSGLSQEQALESLYAHPNFDPATMQVIAIRKAGDGWVSKIKEAEFPPSDDGGDDAPEPEEKKENPFGGDDDGDDGGDDAPSDDGPPSPDGDGPPKEKGGESHEIMALMSLVQQIADKLGIMPEPDMPGAGDPMGMGPDVPPGPPGPPHGGAPPPPPPPGPGPHGGHGAPGAPPGMNPAFASTQEQIVGRVASFTASETTGMPLTQAKVELEQLYGPHGYKVKQLREARDQSGQRVVHALLSVR